MGRDWGGQSAAERSAARRERLLAAALELIAEAGVGGTTVREVCRRARLNPRYFYESFADLDALLVAAFDAVVAETVAAALSAIAAAGDTEESKTRAAIGASFRHLAADPARIRLVLAEALGNAALAARRVEAVRLCAELMADQAAAFHGLPRDDRLLRSTTYMLAGGVSELLIAWHNRSLELTLDELIEDAAALIVGTSRGTGALVRSRTC